MLAKIVRSNAKLFNTVSHARFASKILEGTQDAATPLSRTDQSALVSQQWTMKPFAFNEQMQVPIYDFVSGQQTDSIVELDQSIYNVPLRRDIIHNVFHYFEKKDRYILKKTKDFGDVAGSGKKPTPQKGGGRSRQGNRRAPQRAGGGIAHGPVPRCLGFPLNSKTRLLALKCMLSAKLYEDRLIVIDSE
jgi:large subunit ribosomal protein L4